MKAFRFFSLLAIISMVSMQSLLACTTPSGLAVSVSGTSATVTWGAVAGVTGYRVVVEDATGNPVAYASNSLTITATSYTATGLTVGMPYKYKVRSICGTQTSNWSSWTTFNTSTGGGNGCGVAPSGAAVTPSASSATISWPAVSGVTGYRVVVEDGSGNPVNYQSLSGTITATTFTATGLNPSSKYKYKVRTVCGTQTSPWTTWKTFSTLTALMTNEASFATADMETLQAKVYPNPVQNNLTIDVNQVEAMPVVISIFTAQGARVVRQSFEAEAGMFSAKMDVSTLPQGLYFVKIEQGSVVSTQQLLVQR